MKCKRCGEEMSVKEINGRNYFVCENCKIKKAIVDDPEDDYIEIKPFNKSLIIALVLTVLYFIYSFFYWSNLNTQNIFNEQLGTDTASIVIFPHLLTTLVAALFNTLAVFMKKRALALTSGILYIIAIVLFPLRALFIIIQTVLSFVGFVQMKRQ